MDYPLSLSKNKVFWENWPWNHRYLLELAREVKRKQEAMTVVGYG